MDDLSAQYLLMANGPGGNLHSPAAVVNFVDQMQLAIDRSSAPRKNFLLDTTTPRGDVIITEASAMKPGNGWITLQVTEGIRRGVHEWCVKIEHQGETTDGSGLMLGILPKNFTKYDSFISQGGGWCLSRAGKFYGHWRRQDTSASVVFGTGDRVTFILDYEAARMTVRVGEKSVVGEISNLAPEVYPAVSLHYRHQFVRFEYHKVHDRHSKKFNWIERMAFPHASVYLPLTEEQLEKMPLDSYVFSPLFIGGERDIKWRKRQQSSATASSMATATNTNTALKEPGEISDKNDEVGVVSQYEYESPRAANARLTVVLRAIQAVRRYCSGSITSTDAFIDRGITAEMLRKHRHALVSRGAGSHGGLDAALNCGALVLIHMFAHAATTFPDATMLPMVYSLQEYLRSISLFSLGEASAAPHHVGTSLSSEVVRLAADSVARLLERFYAKNGEGEGGYDRGSSGGGGSGCALSSALVELLVLLGLQCGAVSDVLRSVRYLLRTPAQETSPGTLLWFRKREAALAPKVRLPNLGEAYDAVEDMEQLTHFGRDLDSTILSVGYGRGAVYVHMVSGLSKWSNVTSAYTLVCSTCEPANCCLQCAYSTIGLTESGTVLLLTNRMVAADVAVVVYSTGLEILQKVALSDVSHWPLNPRFISLTSGPGDRILLVYVNSPPVVTAADTTGSCSSELEMQVFNGSTFPALQWCTTLHAVPFDRTLDSCLKLCKGSVIDFGAPEACLSTVGGYVTVEVWIKILERDDASVFYQHGDRSTSGEVFLETARLEGAWRIRGGYRHDSRGMCIVTAPVNPASESKFLHVALVFDGNWRLYFDGEEVSRTKQGPQVSLENPRQRWTAGNDCVCQIAALRVWKGALSVREIVRDSCRFLSGDEPGLLCQYLFNEQNGNVVYNHVRAGAAVGHHAIIRGPFTRVGCIDHPMLSSVGDDWPAKAEATLPTSNTTSAALGDLPRLEGSRIFFDGMHLGIIERRERGLPGFAELKHAHRVVFFNIKTGRKSYGGYVLQHRNMMGLLGCDLNGYYWDLFRTSSSGNLGGGTGDNQHQQQHQRYAVAVGVLSVLSSSMHGGEKPIWYNDPNPPHSCVAQGSARVCAESMGGGCVSIDSGKNGGDAALPDMQQHEGARRGESSWDIRGPGSSFKSLALWLLNLLSSFAEPGTIATDNPLFSPLLDDVGARCVQEVQLLLHEHCRGVKAINARRSANLKDHTSATVIATALRVLMRVIRRVRDFKFHPDTIGLSAVTGTDDIGGMLHELNIIQRRRGSNRQEVYEYTANTQEGGGLGAATMMTAASSSSRVDETLSGASHFAKHSRASLFGVLSDIINEAGFNLPAELAVLARVIVQEGVTLFFPSALVRAELLREILKSNHHGVMRSQALNVLLHAIVGSFADITCAAALVQPTCCCSGGGNDIKAADSTSFELKGAHVVIKTTLSILLEESSRQITSRAPDDSRHGKLTLLVAMSEAIGTLQLLLFSHCGSVWSADASDAWMHRCIENYYSLPSPLKLSVVVKEYYTELLDIAEMTVDKIVRRLVASQEKPPVAESAMTAMVPELVGSSFLGFPLHTAITALPLMVSRDESDWLLEKLTSLRACYRSLVHLVGADARPNAETTGCWPLPVLDTALLLASSLIASFMSLGQLVPKLPEVTGKSFSSSSSDATESALQELCDHPLLGAGLRETGPPGSEDFVIIQELLQKRAIWEEVAGRVDALAAKTPADVCHAMSLAAAAAVHLSGVQLYRLKEQERIQLLAGTLLRLKGARNELLNSRSKNPNDFSRLVCEVHERCQLLLRMKRISESESVQMSSLLLARSFVERVVQAEENALKNKVRSSRWRRVALIFRAQRMYHMALLNGWPLLQIDVALALVERIIFSSEATAARVQAVLVKRETAALRRLSGFQHMLFLFRSDPLVACKVASLFFSGAVGLRSPFLLGISGCLDVTRCAVRRSMYDLLHRLCNTTTTSSVKTIEGGKNGVGVDGLVDAVSLHSATLSEVLNRKWHPGDFCYLEQLRVVEVVFRTFCSIFNPADPEMLRCERATECSHRYKIKNMQKKAVPLSAATAETVDDGSNEVAFQRSQQENALLESLKALKSLGLQCAVLLGDAAVGPGERRGCVLFLDRLFGELEMELSRCSRYVARTYPSLQDRVFDQISLLCTLASTIARALPERFLCSDYSCPKVALMALRLCTTAKELSMTVDGGSVEPNLIDVCIFTSTLLLRHCQPVAANHLFAAEHTGALTREASQGSDLGCATLGFFFFFACRCISSSCTAGLNERGLRCIDALHTLVCQHPWDKPFISMSGMFLHDLSNKVEGEEVARANSIRVLMWMYAIGGSPVSVLAPGQRLRMSVDDTLITTEVAYIVDYHTQSNIATVLPALSSTLEEEREVLLDGLISASQQEIILPCPDFLHLFLLPALKHFFRSSLQPHPSPIIWAIIAGLLRITLGVLKNHPVASQSLLEGDLISLVDNFAFRTTAKSPLPLCYLQEVTSIVLPHLLRCSRQIPLDAAVSPSLLNDIQSSSRGLYNQPLLNVELHRLLPFSTVSSFPATSFGAGTVINSSAVLYSEPDPKNGNFLPPSSRLPQTHSSLSLTPSVLCFGGTKDALSGTLVVKATTKKSCIPQWTDGVTLDASVLLYDRLFPELGEDFVIPSSWRRPEIHFTLFSLYDRASADASAILRVVLSEESVDCVIENTKGATTIVSTKLLREDWDHWIHMAVVLESKTITLYKDGIGTTAILPKLLGSRLEALLREGIIDRLVLGNETRCTAKSGCRNSSNNSGGSISMEKRNSGSTATTTTTAPTTNTATTVSNASTNVGSGCSGAHTIAPTTTKSNSNNNNAERSRKGEACGSVGGSCGVLDGMIVAVDSVRLWGCARMLKAQRTTADFVAREQTLPVVGIVDGCHFTFRFSEATGSETFSENKECVGTLHGNVRWTPFPVFSGKMNLDRVPRIDPASHTELPLFIPRYEFDSFFAALDRVQLIRVGSEWLQSLCAHLSRYCVVAAIRQSVSPEYRIMVLEKRRRSSCDVSTECLESVADPRCVIPGPDFVRHVINLLRYSDTGAVDEETLRAVSKFIKLCFHSVVPEKQLTNSFREAALAISEALQEEVESFCVELPPPSHAATDVLLVPIATVNGPGGVISFDANSRGIEHLSLLRDRKQKALLAKYPDAQGGWPDLEIPDDSLWFYAKPIVGTRSVSPSFTVSARSLKPFVACSVFGAIRDIFLADPRYHCGLPYFLNTPFLSLLTLCAGTTRCSAVPGCRLLTAVLELWRQLPHFAQHDQSPLKIVLAHLNVPLMAILHRGQISSSSPSLLSSTLGHYNLAVQSAFELLIAAIRLEAAWKGVSHEYSTRNRWRRLFSLWERSIGHGTPSAPSPLPALSAPAPSASATKAGKLPDVSTIHERGYVCVAPLPSSGSPMQHRPKATIFQRGTGVWHACCDRGSLSVRSSVGFKRGRFYFEVRVPASGDPISVGVVTERAQQHSILGPRGLGHDAESWGFDSAQMCRFYHGFRHEFSVRTKWKGLDVIGILLDLEAETLVCVHDDRQVSVFDNLKANRGSGVPTSFFPAVSFGSSGVDINFGAAPFACNLPVGFLPVDPSNYMTSPTSKLWTLLAAVSVGEALAGNNDVSGDYSSTTVSVESRRLPSFFARANADAMTYYAGRSGPLTVSLLPCDSRTKMASVHGSEVRAEDDPCFVRGSVCVRSGRWYYEVVLRGEAMVSVGWATSTATTDWSRSKSLGDDADSWVLEGSRTTARHNKHQRSIGGQLWKHGDVVGCMVDCDIGTIAYSVNGLPLRELHDTNGDGILFSSVDCSNGLMPVVAVDPKNAVSIYFRDDELSFHPCGYRTLSTTRPMRTALEELHCMSNHTEDAGSKNECGGGELIFFPTRARHLLSSLTSMIELNFINASAYCLEDVLSKCNSAAFYEKFGGQRNAVTLLVTLQNLTTLAECMISYTHAALFPAGYDVLLSGPMCRALRHCCDYMLPVVGLRILHGFFSQTSCPGENFKLTLNRRKALSLVKDKNAPLLERVRGSLFGQVYHLLRDKSVSLFCTSRKLWSVNFVGEGADDIGGPYRECLTQLCSELMSSDLPLFIPSPNQVNDVGESREVFVVRPEIQFPVRITMYHFFGRLIAGCLRSAEPLPIYLPSRMWKVLVGAPVDVNDLGVVDRAALQSYQYIQRLLPSCRSGTTTDEELAELFPGGFSTVDDAGIERELFPGGREVDVGRCNVELFLNLSLRYKLHTMGRAQIQAVADGFHQVVPLAAVSLLKWYELEQVVCGQPDYDADALLDSARYEDLDPNDTIVVYLRQVLRQFSRQERALFMRFVSGRERLPSGVRLKLMPDTSAQLLRDGGGGGVGSNEVFDDSRLPHASTCFYWLSIPRYSSAEVMRERLLFAIQQCLDIDADFVVHENGNYEDYVEPTLAVNVDEDEEFEDFSHLR